MDSKQSRNGAEQKNTLDAPPDQYSCVQCYQLIDSDQKDEHEDWHFAKDLEAEDQAGQKVAMKQSQIGSNVPQLSSKQDVAPDYPPPNYPPPTYPPPRSAPSVARPIRHHTNQVIEAAKIRARDEVIANSSRRSQRAINGKH
jgi:hypothetical protein